MKKVILTLLVPFFCACTKSQGTSTGNPFIGFMMTASSHATTVAKTIFDRFFLLAVKSSLANSPPATMLDAANNTVTIGTFWVSLEKIEFKANQLPDAGEVDGTEIEFSGPFVVDLLTTPSSDLVSGGLAVSNFHRLKYKLKAVSSLPAGAPSGLVGRSVYISGTVNGKSFVFSPAAQIEVTTAGANLVSAQPLDRVLLQFRVADMVRRINLSALSAGAPIAIDENTTVNQASPCPTIDSTATNLYTCFMGALGTEANVGRDTNGNGDLDASEQSIK